MVKLTYCSSYHPACCLQLAGQNIEDFMAKRGFHAMPEHEDTWAVPVSQVPAAYNLHAQMQADRAEGEEEAELAKDRLDEEAFSLRSKQPRKPKQQVYPHASMLIHGRLARLPTCVECFCNNTSCLYAPCSRWLSEVLLYGCPLSTPADYKPCHRFFPAALVSSS